MELVLNTYKRTKDRVANDRRTVAKEKYHSEKWFPYYCRLYWNNPTGTLLSKSVVLSFNDECNIGDTIHQLRPIGRLRKFRLIILFLFIIEYTYTYSLPVIRSRMLVVIDLICATHMMIIPSVGNLKAWSYVGMDLTGRCGIGIKNRH